MKFDFSEEWCKKAADLEEGHNVAAGVPMNITQVTHYPVLNRGELFDEYNKFSTRVREVMKEDSDDRNYGLVTSPLRCLRMLWKESIPSEKVPEHDEDASIFFGQTTLFGYKICIDNDYPYMMLSASELRIEPVKFSFDKYEEGPSSEAFKTALQAIRIAIIDHESSPDIEV